MGPGRSKYDDLGPLSGSQKVQPSRESDCPTREGVRSSSLTSPRAHLEEGKAVWTQPTASQTESRCNIDCERGNQRRLRQPSDDSVKLAVVDLRLLLTLCVFALGEGAEGEQACGCVYVRERTLCGALIHT